MKRFLKKRKVQKLYLPLAFVCIIPLWTLLRQGNAAISAAAYLLAGLGALFFLLDRIFKPWETARAEKTWKAAEQSRNQSSPGRDEAAK